MLSLTPEELERVEEMAAALTPIREIAALLGYPADEVRTAIADQSTDIHRAYERGKASTALAFRKQEIDFALNGSPIAAQLMPGFLSAMANDESF